MECIVIDHGCDEDKQTTFFNSGKLPQSEDRALAKLPGKGGP